MRCVCFVDDDKDFEIPLFERVFGDVYDVIAADDYEAAKRRIAERRDSPPELFVLDLYFPSGQPDDEDVSALRRTTVTYKEDRAEMRTAYGNYLRAESRHKAVLDAWRQGPDGGLEIARRVVLDYPNVPIVFYSRKATFEDEVRCMAAEGVWGLEKKPTGGNDEETECLTLAEKPRLVRRFNAIIAREDEERTFAIKKAAETIWRSRVRS
jgi:CheY-like chemotaxis protein